MPLVEEAAEGQGPGGRAWRTCVYPRPRPARPSRIFADGSRKSNNEESSLVALFRNGRVDARRAPRRERRANTKPSFRKTKKPIFFFTLPSPCVVVTSTSFVPPVRHPERTRTGQGRRHGAIRGRGPRGVGDERGRPLRRRREKRAASASKSVAVGLVRREPRGGGAGRGDLTRALDEMSAVKRDSRSTDSGTDTDGLVLVAAAKARAHMGAVATSAAQAFLALALFGKRRLCPSAASRRWGAVSAANCVSLAGSERARRHENKNVSRKRKTKCADGTYTTKKPSVNASSARASRAPSSHSESVPCFRRSAFEVHTPLTGRRAPRLPSALSARDAQHTTAQHTGSARTTGDVAPRERRGGAAPRDLRRAPRSPRGPGVASAALGTPSDAVPSSSRRALPPGARVPRRGGAASVRGRHVGRGQVPVRHERVRGGPGRVRCGGPAAVPRRHRRARASRPRAQRPASFPTRGGADDPLRGDGVTGRKDLAGFLGWDAPHRDPFREVLCHPKLVPYLHDLVGPDTGWTTTRSASCRTPARRASSSRSGSTLEGGSWNHPLGYDFKHGKMRCNLLAFAVHLTDTNEGDGGFCIVRGSHKATSDVRVIAVEAAKAARISPRSKPVRRRLHRSHDARHVTVARRAPAAEFNLQVLARDERTAAGGRRRRVPLSYWRRCPTRRGRRCSRRTTRVWTASPSRRRRASSAPAPREKHKVDFDRAVFKADYF